MENRLEIDTSKTFNDRNRNYDSSKCEFPAQTKRKTQTSKHSLIFSKWKMRQMNRVCWRTHNSFMQRAKQKEREKRKSSNGSDAKRMSPRTQTHTRSKPKEKTKKWSYCSVIDFSFSRCDCFLLIRRRNEHFGILFFAFFLRSFVSAALVALVNCRPFRLLFCRTFLLSRTWTTKTMESFRFSAIFLVAPKKRKTNKTRTKATTEKQLKQTLKRKLIKRDRNKHSEGEKER